MRLAVSKQSNSVQILMLYVACCMYKKFRTSSVSVHSKRIRINLFDTKSTSHQYHRIIGVSAMLYASKI